MRKNNVLIVGFAFVLGTVLGMSIINELKKKQLMESRRTTDKFSDFYQLLSHWLEVKNLGGSTAAYFEEMGYRKIAIYGMGELANRLSEDLGKSGIVIAYGVDRNVCSTPARMEEVYTLEDELPEVDAMIVTPFYAMGDIQNVLKTKIDCPIISLEEVVWSV